MKKLLIFAALLATFTPGAFASSWYVRSLTACANSGNGTSSACAASPGGVGAWRGFASIGWASVVAGDTLYLQAGDTYAEQLTVGSSGTSASPITISVNGAGTAIIDGGDARSGFNFNGRAYIVLNGITGNAAFGGSQTYGIRVINIGLSNFCVYINNAETAPKILHIECSGNGQNIDNSVNNAVPLPDDSHGGIYSSNGVHFAEIAYNWFHTQMGVYNLSSCSISGGTYTCTTTTTISDTHWTSPSVPTPSVGIYGNTGVNGHCALRTVSGTTFTCTGGGSGTGTGGVAVMEWAATAVTGFFASGSTSYTETKIHDNLVYGVFNDGYRCNGNCQIYHNEAAAGMGSGHSDALLAQSSLYVEIFNNYVHDWNDQNCYLDNLSPAVRGHIHIFNNIFDSPTGFGGCNVDPEGASSVWDDIVMINNTSYASRDYVVHFGGQGGTVTNFVYVNNISRVSGSQGSPPWGAGGGIAFVTTGDPFDYNVYSPTLGVQYPIIANYSGGNKNIAQLRGLSPAREVNGNTCNVTYVGGALPAGAQPSPSDTCARVKGANLAAAYPFAATDFNGNTRGATWDIGAINAGGSSTVATPTFSPADGSYGAAQSVTISTITGGATKCYTTDGSTPTANGAGTCTHGTTYTSPVSVAVSETLSAIGSLTGFSDSAVGIAVYVINGAVATPTFSPVAGTYGGTQSVTISSTAGATICYTADGSIPTADGAGTCTSGTTYTVPISVSASQTLTAIGSKSGFIDSASSAAIYVITAGQTISPAPAIFTGGQGAN